MYIVAMYTNSVAGIVGPTPGYLVWRLSIKWRVAVDRALAPLGLTHAQYVFLASLLGMQRTGGQPCQRELADHTGLEPLYISKLARTLEADGLIERTRDRDDTRTVRLALTGLGRKTVRPAIAIVQELLDTLLAPLGGQGDPRTDAFVRDLTVLLGAPLNPGASPTRQEPGHA
jgi:MarR family transcriptional regulator, organic hydroperoxide resistance regulator